jgi:hypothetical protein
MLYAMCPHCKKFAPVVHRSLMAYCTACGALRGPVTTHSVSLAGQPAQIGGTVATVFSWMVLIGGWSLALILFAISAALFGLAPITWILSVPVAITATAIGLGSRYGGKSLKQSGEAKQRTTEEQAIFALAEQRKGRLRALDVAASLNRSVPEADHLMTEMAKRHPEHMAVDVTDGGELEYRFPRIDLEHRTRVVEAEVLRGDAQQAGRTADAKARVAEPQRVAVGVRPAPEVIDAEFDDVAEPVRARRTR